MSYFILMTIAFIFGAIFSKDVMPYIQFARNFIVRVVDKVLERYKQA